MKLFSPKHQITPKYVDSIIDFSGRDEKKSSMKQLQDRGVAGLYNILCKNPVAYLADEVGLGKTYQALGVIALACHLKKEARIAIIAPRLNLQIKWQRDYLNFTARCYRFEDDQFKTALTGEPTKGPVRVENLRQFAENLHSDRDRLFILRHSSFSRPVFLNSSQYDEGSSKIWHSKQIMMSQYGLQIHEPSNEDRTLLNKDKNNISFCLNRALGKSFNTLLSDLSNDQAPFFDLVIVDEAQYLRNENQSNTVFSEVFRNQVAKWLLLSATPIHRRNEDVPNVVNRCLGNAYLSNESTADDEALKRSMKPFTIRRSRSYLGVKSTLDL